MFRENLELYSFEIPITHFSISSVVVVVVVVEFIVKNTLEYQRRNS